jgi:nitroreductase
MGKKSSKDLGLIEGLHSTPARRYVSSGQIKDEVLMDILDTAIRGPSGGNNQGWGWIILKCHKKAINFRLV